VLSEIDLVLTGDRRIRIDVGAILNLLTRKVDREHPRIPVRPSQRSRRQQHEPLAEPAAGVGDHVADGPPLIVEQKVVNFADLAISGDDFRPE